VSTEEENISVKVHNATAGQRQAKQMVAFEWDPGERSTQLVRIRRCLCTQAINGNEQGG
jgi:hypothetical protein